MSKQTKELVRDPRSLLMEYPGLSQTTLLLIRLGLSKGPEWVDGYDPDDDSVDLKYDKVGGRWIELHSGKGYPAAWYYMDSRRKPIIGSRP